MANKLRVGILFGGRSAEHEVSLVSARNIMAAADPNKYEVVPIGITKLGQWRVGERALGLLGSGDTNSDWSQQQQAVLERGCEVMLASNPSARSPLIPVKATVPGSGSPKLDVIFPVLHGTLGED